MSLGFELLTHDSQQSLCQNKTDSPFVSFLYCFYLCVCVCVCVCVSPGSWADRSPLHEAASQGRLLALRTLLAQVRPHYILIFMLIFWPFQYKCQHIKSVRCWTQSIFVFGTRTYDGVLSSLFSQLTLLWSFLNVKE